MKKRGAGRTSLKMRKRAAEVIYIYTYSIHAQMAIKANRLRSLTESSEKFPNK